MRFSEFLNEKAMNAKTFADTKGRLGNSALVGFEFEMVITDESLMFSEVEHKDTRRTEFIKYFDTLREFKQYFAPPYVRFSDINDDYEEWQIDRQIDNPGDETDFSEWLKTEFANNWDFINHYGLDPEYGWCDVDGENSSVYIEDEGEDDPEYPDPEYPDISETAENVKRNLQMKIDAPISISDTYHGMKGIGSHSWRIEPDSSIKGDGHGIEIITPPYELNKSLTTLKMMCDWIDENAETNTSTGLHINISIPDIAKKLDPVKLVLFLGEEYSSKMFDRLRNTFTMPQIDTIMTAVQLAGKIPSTGKEMIDIASAGISKDEKYKTINLKTLKQGYLEFRLAGGKNYEQDPKKLNDMVMRMVTALEIACDPGAERQEYLKKLAAIFNQGAKAAQSRHITKDDKEDIPEELHRLYKYSPIIREAWLNYDPIYNRSDPREEIHKLLVLMDYALRTVKDFKSTLELKERLFFKKQIKRVSLHSGDVDEFCHNDHLKRLQFKKELGI